MYKPANQIRIGDTVFYDGENLKVTVSHPHLATQKKHVLEFEDKGDENQLLGVVIRSSTEIQVLEPHLIK